MKKRYKDQMKKLFCAVSMAAMLMQHANAATADTWNHVDWPESCLKASDLFYTHSEITTLITQNILEQKILEECSPVIFLDPDWQEGGRFTSADISMVQAEPGNYTVTLYARSATEMEDYITITLKVEDDSEQLVQPEEQMQPEQPTQQEAQPAEQPAPKEPAQQSSVITQIIPTETIDTEIEREEPSKEEIPKAGAKTPSEAKNVTKKSGPYTHKIEKQSARGWIWEHLYIGIYSLAGLFILGCLCISIPSIYALTWFHKKKKEKRLRVLVEYFQKTQKYFKESDVG